MVHQSEDQLFKYATKEDGIGLLKLLKESNANIKEIDFESENLTYNPTELVELDPKIYKTDMILELDHLIVLTEFQSTIVKTPDEKRYRLYTALVDYAKRNNKPIMLIVISTAEKTKIKQYKINKDCVFTIPIVSLKDFDGDKISDEPTVVKRKTIDTSKPMDINEAILQMEFVSHDFFIFKDSQTKQICVLYKRCDGNYGVIEVK